MWKLLRNLTLAGLVVAGALKLLAGYAVNQDAQRLVTLLAPYAQVKYDGISASLNGDVTLSGVSVAPKNGHRVYRADRVALDTPGLFWLLKHTLLHENAVPPHLAIDAEGVSLPPEPWLNPQWWNAGNFVPFASAGCAMSLSATDFHRMGIDPQPAHQRLQYNWDRVQHNLDAKLDLDAPGFATVALEMQLSHFDPAALGTAAFWNAVHLDQMSANYADLGFFARRNRYCAEHAKLTPAQFVERHVDAVQALLNQSHIQPADELLRIYKALVSSGGHASVLSLPSSSFANSAWRIASREELLRQLNVTARYQDKPPIMFRLAFSAPPESRANLPSDSAVTAAAATDPATTTPAASAPPAAMAPGPVKPTPQVATAASPQAATAASAVAPTPPKVSVPVVVVTPPIGTVAVKVPATELNYLDRAEARLAPLPKPAPPPTPASQSHAAPLAAAGASTAEPPPNSTLALIWKPGVIEPLPEETPSRQDYDIVEFARLAELSGRHVRLVTQGGKSIEGFVVSADATSVLLRVKRGGGDAQFSLAKARIDQVQLLHW